MTSPHGGALRAALPQEMRDMPPDRSGTDFRLVAQSQKIHRATDAPVIFFDVLASSSDERIGIANLILQQGSDGLADVGHVCVKLAEQRGDPQRLAQVARAIFEHAFEAGLPEVSVVVPAGHAPSVEACRLLAPVSSAGLTLPGGEDGLAYLYKR